MRRVKNQPALARLRAAHVARVRRTAAAVERGRVKIEEVEGDIRGEVDQRVKGREK